MDSHDAKQLLYVCTFGFVILFVFGKLCCCKIENNEIQEIQEMQEMQIIENIENIKGIEDKNVENIEKDI